MEKKELSTHEIILLGLACLNLLLGTAEGMFVNTASPTAVVDYLRATVTILTAIFFMVAAIWIRKA
ncbi:hypothetical protein C5B42_02840 [Candidatus Cerribacteria bacterium 'Amazon FNV 2010 28 9']|uniref:EamA domain-containing protein n=1 Tax=Candidatus Cerribacteria bacterium 'Amazon FNV 2010 28 9' TaxID=2081795 RepID=A0A317JSW1_9BACT|nr:MAG: hypothetical protein C5B42_02840 [Candidatus Cerribacteria bacterium 'Amazon FNV 2010 28 9']